MTVGWGRLTWHEQKFPPKHTSWSDGQHITVIQDRATQLATRRVERAGHKIQIWEIMFLGKFQKLLKFTSEMIIVVFSKCCI